MIDQKDLNSYMNIKAPDSIKKRLISEQANNNSKISLKVRTCYALAASLLVIAVALAFLPSADAVVYLGDLKLDEGGAVIQTISNPNARIATVSAIETQSIPLFIETDTETEITVSRGEIVTDNGTAGQTLTVSSDTPIVWSVVLDSNTDGYTMTVGKDSYCISVNNKAQWVLSKK